MTETAAEVARDILQELVVQGAEAALTADETQSTIRYMNRYMAKLDADGINLGYTKVSDLGDPITIPDGALLGMIKNVAIQLAPQYEIPVSIDMTMAAQDALKTMRNISLQLQEMRYPDTLPIGSGNETVIFGTDHHFYPNRQNEIRTENNQTIIAEDDTP